jgi:hypothetical protein
MSYRALPDCRFTIPRLALPHALREDLPTWFLPSVLAVAAWGCATEIVNNRFFDEMNDTIALPAAT